MRPRRSLLRALVGVVGTALVAALPVVAPRPTVAVVAGPAPTTAPGYWLVGGDGSVYPYGAASDLGSLRGTRLAHPVTGMTPTPSGAGYWIVGSDGGVFSFGDAGFFGSTGNLKLNQPIVGMAATPSGQGYWFVAADGGIFSFGDAAFHGSTGALRLNKPIVGMAATPTGQGYWFVASDGGIFSFGDATFYGSTGAMRLNKPIVGMAPTPTGQGYWFVAADGGIFSFGDADFSGSTGAIRLNRPIVGMAASPSGQGYWFVAADGGIFNFGDAPFLGSAGATSLPAGVVVMAAPVRPGPTGDATSPSGPSATATTASPSTTRPAGTGHPFQIGLVGDTGYTANQVQVFDRVVDDMNRFRLAFVTHDGDFKDPPSACTDERFLAARASFNRSTAPFVYAIGDNEWMDCNNVNVNPNESPMDSLERLDELRELFFAEDASLGVNRMPLTTQRQSGYPENARWSKEGVVFATLHAPGPSDDVPNRDESNPRRMANQAWLQAAFDQAQATNAPAVMIIWQADPWYVSPTGIDFRPTWKYLTDTLRERAIGFGKPVVLVHGDTHVYRIDNPWPDVFNFTRVETHALNDSNHWIRATVDPSDPKVFTFTTEKAG